MDKLHGEAQVPLKILVNEALGGESFVQFILQCEILIVSHKVNSKIVHELT